MRRGLSPPRIQIIVLQVPKLQALWMGRCLLREPLRNCISSRIPREVNRISIVAWLLVQMGPPKYRRLKELRLVQAQIWIHIDIRKIIIKLLKNNIREPIQVEGMERNQTDLQIWISQMPCQPQKDLMATTRRSFVLPRDWPTSRTCMTSTLTLASSTTTRLRRIRAHLYRVAKLGLNSRACQAWAAETWCMQLSSTLALDFSNPQNKSVQQRNITQAVALNMLI